MAYPTNLEPTASTRKGVCCWLSLKVGRGRGMWDVGRGDVGTRDAGTWGRLDVGTRGLGDARGFEDVMNKYN